MDKKLKKILFLVLFFNQSNFTFKTGPFCKKLYNSWKPVKINSAKKRICSVQECFFETQPVENTKINNLVRAFNAWPQIQNPDSKTHTQDHELKNAGFKPLIFINDAKIILPPQIKNNERIRFVIKHNEKLWAIFFPTASVDFLKKIKYAFENQDKLQINILTQFHEYHDEFEVMLKGLDIEVTSKQSEFKDNSFTLF